MGSCDQFFWFCFLFEILYMVTNSCSILYNFGITADYNIYYSINCTYFLYPFKIFKITSSFYLEHCSFKNIKVFKHYLFLNPFARVSCCCILSSGTCLHTFLATFQGPFLVVFENSVKHIF